MEYYNEVINYLEQINDIVIPEKYIQGIVIAILVFGILNMFLGYKLYRFWVVIFSFLLGGLVGYAVNQYMGIEDSTMFYGAIIGLAVLFGIVGFFIYKIGIIMLGACLAFTLCLNFLKPTDSAMFFLCILTGFIVGALSLKFEKQIVIVVTSVIGGFIAGFAAAYISNLMEIYYQVGFGILLSALGIMIQFTINGVRNTKKKPRKSIDEKDNEEDEEYEDDSEEIIPINIEQYRRKIKTDKNYEKKKEDSRKEVPVDFRVGDEDVIRERKLQVVDINRRSNNNGKRS